MNKKLILFASLFVTDAYAIFPEFDPTLEPASKETTELCIRAQDTLGIPKHRQASIHKIHPLRGRDVQGCAYTTRDGYKLHRVIEMNEQNPLKDLAALHEAAHIKYNDSEALIAISKLPKASGLTAAIVTGISLYRKLPKTLSRTPRAMLSYIVGSVIGSSISFVAENHVKPKMYKKYSKQVERRADMTAVQAIACEPCVNQLINIRSAHKKSDRLNYEEVISNGYLSLEELTAMNKEYNTGKYCTHHASRLNRSIDYIKRLL